MAGNTDLPKPGEYSGKAVTAHVFTEALQHPTTLFPAAACLLGAAYMALVSFDPTSFSISVGGGLISVMSWIYHFFVRGKTIGEEYVQSLKEKRVRIKVQQAGDVEEECRAAGFSDGAKEAQELGDAYSRLRDFLEEKLGKRREMTAKRFQILAEDTYQQGLLLLRRALEMYKALKQIDYYKLTREKQAFETEIRIIAREENPSKQPIIDALKSKIESHDKRLVMYTGRKESLEQLMAECEVLESALDTSYLQVVDLVEDEVQLQRSNVAGNLERAVAAARRVEERLRGDGRDDDSIYLNHDKD